ncbi:MAG TPA: DUF4358 domain-containing protein [Lachnospiraceae bacterium]|nr:DUF4358 domain-containing protein [Lachnospiraceae bacterium]
MKKQKKMMEIIGLLFVVMLLAVGCGKKAASIDVIEVANELLEGIPYQDALTAIDFDTADMIFNFSDVTIVNGAIFESSGATAEEIVVLECASAEDAKAAKTALETRVSEQEESFEDYVPEELVKLNEAVIVTSGKYAILSVSNEPDEAEKIIDGFIR